MATLNKVMIIGNLGNDPETKYTQDGRPVTKISVATTDKWKDKQSGEQRSKTEWHRVVAFDRLAEIMGEYLKKGSPVYVEGKLQTSTYEKDGSKRYSTEIIAQSMQMLGDRNSQQQPAQQGQFQQQAQQNQFTNLRLRSGSFLSKHNAPTAQQGMNAAPGPIPGPPDDDIPF
jgi:single-strand DNA-binding protein